MTTKTPKEIFKEARNLAFQGTQHKEYADWKLERLTELLAEIEIDVSEKLSEQILDFPHHSVWLVNVYYKRKYNLLLSLQDFLQFLQLQLKLPEGFQLKNEMQIRSAQFHGRPLTSVCIPLAATDELIRDAVGVVPF